MICWIGLRQQLELGYIKYEAKIFPGCRLHHRLSQRKEVSLFYWTNLEICPDNKYTDISI